ncbi:MAG: alpha/beta fold hydrolase [Planktomarina sp.]|nr:alpha/beta fold hydrolase [Planktomarina sp.]MDT2032816.1 alpha/beta fold hydrolase [Planktomarina sp.]MDT2039350.1 alpha/beta fold hydrolase [Planktomarina sp.]MDT2049155.1 alpha/beta fold hydrolase [Planktomarina sp.]|tara:strand:- start:1016 stop:1714 length:699 start_codon:yes stop_codon:yes gene_type:complete
MNSEPIVFLPGMMCDARLFAPQIDGLSHQCAVMVAPTHLGERVEQIASSILDMAPQRFALCGLSMGGIVALEIIRRAPDRVKRLCLMDTNPMCETPERAAEREPQIIAARTGRLEQIMREEITLNYLTETLHKEHIFELLIDMGMSLGSEAFVRQSRALQKRRDQQSFLSKIKCPTLLLCGEQDQICLPKRHKFMAELIEGAKLTIIKNAGHLPTLEQPEATNEALRAWLAT